MLFVQNDKSNRVYQEEQYEQALKKFANALQIAGFKPHLSYNVALCYFKLKEYAASLKHIGEVRLNAALRPFRHPQLCFVVFQQTSSNKVYESIRS